MLTRRAFLALAGALTLTGCAASRAQPAGPEYPGLVTDIPAPPRHTLLGIGHSYMAGAGASEPERGLLPLTAAGIGYAYVNAGLGSTDVDTDGVQPPGSSGLARVTSVLAQARFDAALVVYGINAIGGHRPDGSAIDPAGYQSDYARFLTLLRPGISGPIVCSGIPATPNLADRDLAPWNAAIQAATQSVSGVTFVDLTGVFNPGNFAQLIGPDGTHPTDAGHALLAQHYVASLKPLVAA